MKKYATSLEVDLAAVASNFEIIQKKSGLSECAPVLKANAYGAGVEKIAHFLSKSFPIKTIFVATLAEGISLRKFLEAQGYFPSIYVFEGLSSDERLLSFFKKYALSPVLNTEEEILIWTKSSLSQELPAAIQVNIGLNRFGVEPESLAAIKEQFTPEILLAHLSCAGLSGSDRNLIELEIFRQAATFFPNARKSLSASAGVFLGKDYHFDVIRPGAGLYGPLYSDAGAWDLLKNACRFSVPLLQVRKVKKGSSVGYDALWRAPEDVYIGTVAAGYADGLSSQWNCERLVTCAHEGSEKRFPIVGRISMDSAMVNLGKTQEIAVGERVYFFSNAFPAVKFAAQLGISVQELLTKIGSSARIQRKYSGG